MSIEREAKWEVFSFKGAWSRHARRDRKSREIGRRHYKLPDNYGNLRWMQKREWAANEAFQRSSRWAKEVKAATKTLKSDSSSISSQIICNFCLFKNYIRPISVWVICTERERERPKENISRTHENIFLYYLFPAPRLHIRKEATYIILFRSLTGFIAELR